MTDQLPVLQHHEVDIHGSRLAQVAKSLPHPHAIQIARIDENGEQSSFASDLWETAEGGKALVVQVAYVIEPGTAAANVLTDIEIDMVLAQAKENLRKAELLHSAAVKTFPHAARNAQN